MTSRDNEVMFVRLMTAKLRFSMEVCRESDGEEPVSGRRNLGRRNGKYPRFRTEVLPNRYHHLDDQTIQFRRLDTAQDIPKR